MNDTPSAETTVAEVPAVNVKVPKAAKKKSAPAKKPTPKADKTTTTTEYGMDKSRDLPWTEKKVAVFKALKSLHAFGSSAAKSSGDIAAKAGLTPHDVRHYCYHAKVSGLTGISKMEGVAGYSFYLTAKGQKIDPVQTFKEQQSSKK